MGPSGQLALLLGLGSGSGSLAGGASCRFGSHLGAQLLQVVLEARIFGADVAQLFGAAAQFELRDDMPRQDPQGLLLFRTQVARHFVNDTQGPQGIAA